MRIHPEFRFPTQYYLRMSETRETKRLFSILCVSWITKNSRSTEGDGTEVFQVHKTTLPAAANGHPYMTGKHRHDPAARSPHGAKEGKNKILRRQYGALQQMYEYVICF